MPIRCRAHSWGAPVWATGQILWGGVMECPHCGRDIAGAERLFCPRCALPVGSGHSDTTSAGNWNNNICTSCGEPFGNIASVFPDRNNHGLFAVGDAERRLVTVLFADAVNYTSLADTSDPEDVYQIIGECFRKLYSIVLRHGGIVTHFAGDGIMALFGAPVAQEDHARRACYAALSMQESMAEFGTRVEKAHGTGFSIRVGINSGLAIVGVLGQGYTALGDTVNVAARLQTLGNSGSITVSGETYRLAGHFFAFEELGAARLKGKRGEIFAYRILGAQQPTDHRGPQDGDSRFFVGRNAELALLADLFAKVKSGSGRAVTVVGEAGVGKSSMLRKFIQGLSEDHLFLEGECLQFGSPIAYLPVRDALKPLLFLEESLREDRIREQIEAIVDRFGLDQSAVVPPLCELLAVKGNDEAYLRVDPSERQLKIFSAVRDLLVKGSYARPLVILLENLSWIDKSSERLIAFVISALAASRVMLILAHRPDYEPPAEVKRHVAKISLKGLSQSECPTFLEHLLVGQKTPPEIRQFVVNRSKGNPLFIEELVHSIVENGYAKDNNKSQLNRKLLEMTLPDTIQDILSARIDRLAPWPKRVLQRAAVIGKAFTIPLLARIAGGNVEAGLRQLEEAEFINPGESNDIYEFRHDLIQEVAYGRLLIRQRKDLHRIIARALEEAQKEGKQEMWEILAHHYSMSDETRKASQYLRLSGDKMTSHSSLWEGLNYYKAALGMLKKEPSSDRTRAEQLELYQLMASPMISLGFPEDSLDLLTEGEKLARESDSSRLRVTFTSLIGLYCSVRGQLAEGQKYTEQCLKIAEESGDIDLIASTAFDACSNYSARGAFVEATRIAEKVTRLIEKEHREGESLHRGYNIYTALLGFWGFSEAYLGHFSEGERLCRKGLDWAEPMGNLPSLGLLETCYGYVLAHQGRGREAMAHFEKAMKYLEKGNVFVLLGLACAGLGWAHFFAGEWEMGEQRVLEGLAIHSRAGIHYKSSIHYWFLAQMCRESDRIEDAKKYAQSALDHSRSNNEAYLEGIALVLAGSCYLGKKGVRKGERCLLDGLQILEDRGIVPYLGVGNLYLAEHYRRRRMDKKALVAAQKARVIFTDTAMQFWTDRLDRSFSRIGV
jgi:class 3 adenylate cyclase/tetratricopeptide (TPR) repeat protein